MIGAALRLLTDNAANQETLKTALGTLIRVLDAVDWDKISKGNPDAWLYFYEDFLEVYDNDLRKLQMGDPMQLSEMDIDGTLKRLVLTEPPSDIQARVVCSCKSRLDGQHSVLIKSTSA